MKKEETKALTSNALDSSIIIHYMIFNKFHSVFDHSGTSLSKTTDTACHLLVIYNNHLVIKSQYFRKN